MKKNQGGLVRESSALPSPVREKPEDLSAPQPISDGCFAGSASGLPRKRVGFIKTNKLDGKMRGPQDQIPPLQERQMALAATRKLFRQLNLPGQCNSEEGSPGTAGFHESGELLRLQTIMGKLQLGPTHTLKAFARELEWLRPVWTKKANTREPSFKCRN